MAYSILLIDDNPSGASVVGKLLDERERVEIVWCRSYEEAFGPLFLKKWDFILINSDRESGNPVETWHRVKGLSDESTTTLLYGDSHGGLLGDVENLARPQKLEQIVDDIRGKIASLQ